MSWSLFRFSMATCFPHVKHLAGITRIKLTSRVAHKIFVALNIYQGIPKAWVMLATGHKTESSFTRYPGVNEAELVATFRRTARRNTENQGQLPANGCPTTPDVAN